MFASARQRFGLSGRRLGAAAALLVLLFLPLTLTTLGVRTMNNAVLIGLLAVAFNLLYGYTGLLSFGHAMFVGMAGYSVALVIGRVVPMLGIGATFGGVSVLVSAALAVVLGTIAATLLAVVIGYFSVQLEEIYFAMITLSFSMAIWVVAQYDHVAAVLPLDVVTNGSDGLDFLTEIGQVNVLGYEFYLRHIQYPLPYYYISLLVAGVALYALWRVVRSPFGTTCKALRENPERAKALGINVQRHRWKTFIVSGAFTGFAGAMLIVRAGGITPSDVHWTASAEPVLVTVIGGPYSFLGPVVGAFTFEFLREFIRGIPALEDYWELSFGILLVAVVLFFDNGVMGGLERLNDWLGECRSHYQQDGVTGVTSFVGSTALAVAITVKDAVLGVVLGVVSGIVGLVMVLGNSILGLVDSVTGRSGPGSSD